MRSRLHILALALLLFAGAALAALSAALQGEPAVAAQEVVNHHDVARAINLLRLHDPRHGTPGRASAALASERDLEVLLSHGARRWLGAASHVTLERGGATVRLSSHLPPNPFGRWLNVELRVVETGGLPAIDFIYLGRLPVPAWLAERAWLRLVERAGLQDELRLAAEVVRRIQFMPQQMQVFYAWRGDSSERLLAALTPPAEQQRLRAYADRLVELAAREAPAWQAPLTRLLAPMFALARSRTADGGDAAAENRAAILALTLFANGRGVAAMLPAARAWPTARPLRLTLAGRDDSALHFLVSAALAAEGTGPLSRAVGLYKEVADSRGGSGFSFSDMAANRAGARMGEMAVQSPQRLQALVAQGVSESDLLPQAADLPQSLPEAEFLRRYGGVGAPAYTTMMGEIDRRVGALSLFR
jgi:hypothetical protein